MNFRLRRAKCEASVQILVYWSFCDFNMADRHKFLFAPINTIYISFVELHNADVIVTWSESNNAPGWCKQIFTLESPDRYTLLGPVISTHANAYLCMGYISNNVISGESGHACVSISRGSCNKVSQGVAGSSCCWSSVVTSSRVLYINSCKQN